LTAYFNVQAQEDDAAAAVEVRSTKMLTRSTHAMEGMVEQQPDSPECERMCEEKKYSIDIGEWSTRLRIVIVIILDVQRKFSKVHFK